MLPTTGYFALGWVLFCLDIMLRIQLVIYLQYILLTDLELPCGACVHVCLIMLVNKGASWGSILTKWSLNIGV